jgi:hypothetical protein
VVAGVVVVVGVNVAAEVVEEGKAGRRVAKYAPVANTETTITMIPAAANFDTARPLFEYVRPRRLFAFPNKCEQPFTAKGPRYLNVDESRANGVRGYVHTRRPRRGF